MDQGDELAARKLTAREKYLRAAAQQAEQPASPSRERYEAALTAQRQIKGMPNSGKWMMALHRQKQPLSDTPVPRRITQALDAGGHEGPEVDEACGVEEPAVDMWEAGLLVPTREQVLRLAFLTGMSIDFFYVPIPKWEVREEDIFFCTAEDIFGPELTQAAAAPSEPEQERLF